MGITVPRYTWETSLCQVHGCAALRIPQAENAWENGTNITVYGSFSRSDNCDRDFQRIAAKFGLRQEIINPPPKLSIREIKEERHVRETKKKPADLAPEASAAKISAADGTTVLEDSKTLAIAVETPTAINDASITFNAVDKPEDKKNPFLA